MQLSYGESTAPCHFQSPGCGPPISVMIGGSDVQSILSTVGAWLGMQ